MVGGREVAVPLPSASAKSCRQRIADSSLGPFHFVTDRHDLFLIELNDSWLSSSYAGGTWVSPDSYPSLQA